MGPVVLLTAGIAIWRIQASGAPEPTPRPTPVPHIRIAAGELRTVPEGSADARGEIVSELEAFFVDLYERAFLPPLPAPTPAPKDPPSPAPTPIPRPSAAELFTAEAAAALADSEDVYGTGPRETVFRGEVTFDGIATVPGEQATDILLEVSFDGRGRIEIEPPDPEEGELGRYHDLRLHQTAQLRLSRSPEGWRISGFDVELRVEELVPPSPGPEAATLRAIEARWMP